MDNLIYISYDADSAGAKIGRAVLADDPIKLKDASDRIRLGNEIIAKWAEQYAGIDFSSGGDQGVWAVPVEAVDDLEMVRKDYEYATNLTVSMGIGKTLSESGKALLVAKFRGKDNITQYSPEIEDEIREAKEHLQQGTASEEERKLGEAYLQPEPSAVTVMAQETNNDDQSKSDLKDDSDCSYCKAMQEEKVDDPSHCKYCHDMGKDEKEEPCKYCQQMSDDNEENDLITPSDPSVKNPTTTSAEDFEGQGLNTPDLPKPPPIQEVPESVTSAFDPETVENTKLATIGPTGKGRQEMVNGKIISSKDNRNALEDTASDETAQDIADQIGELSPDADEHANNTKDIDDTNLAIGDKMHDGTSRVEDFDEENAPKDMGLSEENDEDEEQMPDLTSVMEEGLDSHAYNIQQEKAVNLASEALEGFKNCKDILEKAKEQAPQLYESSIAMLKAMIEMAKLLGLDEVKDDGNITNSDSDSLSPREGQNGEHPGKALTAENNAPGREPLVDKPTGTEDSQEEQETGPEDKKPEKKNQGQLVS